MESTSSSSSDKSDTLPLNTELIEDALQLERIDDLLFRSINLWKPSGGRGVFGGQVIAQAAWASLQCVDKKYDIHSLHSYFLNFGNAEIPILYQVEKLRDGRSYATRSVKAIQRGNIIFSMLCSFHVPESYSISHQYDPLVYPGISKPPKLNPNNNNDVNDISYNSKNQNNSFKAWDGPASVGTRQSSKRALATLRQPEECLPTEERLARVLAQNDNKYSDKMKDFIQRQIDERKQSAIEIRSLDPAEIDLMDSSRSSKSIWIRSRAKARNDPRFQKCVLAYASDLNFISVAGGALGLTGRRQIAMMASLDHSMYFYGDNIDVSDWMLYSMESPRVEYGRGVVTGRIYNREGDCLVVTTQEGVVRPKI